MLVVFFSGPLRGTIARVLSGPGLSRYSGHRHSRQRRRGIRPGDTTPIA